MTITDAIKKVIERQNLTRTESEAVLDQIMSGQCTDAQVGALLAALRIKGETIDEVTGFASVMRRKAAAVPTQLRAEEQLGDRGRRQRGVQRVAGIRRRAGCPGDIAGP
jgi:anthranilate phosphoribosyltransferase